MAGRALISRLLASRSSSILRPPAPASFLLRLRPLACSSSARLPSIAPSLGGITRYFATRPATSSLNDPSPNWSNRPPKETILLDGCDFEHWLVVLEPPDSSLTRDEIIDSYIKTLAMVIGSEEEARMKIYSVSTKHYFAFGALVSEELSYKIKELPKVRWVLPDSYLDVKNKDYGGEPFINGQAVPYDPKYHEEWVRNNARAMERSRRNDRPRNFDRSRNFERRRENMQNFQNRDMPPPPRPNQNFQSSDGQNPMPPRDLPPPPAPNSPRDMPPPMPNRDFNAMPPRGAPSGAQHSGGMPNVPNNYQNQMPNPHGGYMPNREVGGYPANPGFQAGGQGYQGGSPGGLGYQGGTPGGPGYQGGSSGYPAGNTSFQGSNHSYQGTNNPSYQAGNPSYQGGSPANPYDSASHQGNNAGGYQGGGSMSYQTTGSSYQGGGYQGESPAYQGRDMPGRDSQ